MEKQMEKGQTDSPWRGEAREGLVAILPVVVSVAAYGLLFGTLAAQQGLSPLETFLMSAMVFAGGSQFVALELWTTPAAIWTLTMAALMVNLRHVLMGASLAPALANWPRRRAYGALLFMADENWALAVRRAAERPLSFSYYAVMAAALYVTWTASTTTGAVLGSGLASPERWGLDFAFAAIFLVLLMGLWRGPSKSLWPWLAAAVAAVATHQVLAGAWYVLAGAAAGTLVGAAMGGEE